MKQHQIQPAPVEPFLHTTTPVIEFSIVFILRDSARNMLGYVNRHARGFEPSRAPQTELEGLGAELADENDSIDRPSRRISHPCVY